MNFGAMHLGHFYLTNLLLDSLKTSSPSRIINVSSIAHKQATIKWSDLQLEKNYSPFFAYSHAKLANLLFTVELAKRLEGTGVTSVSLHPGAVRTDIWREVKQGFSFMTILFTLFTPFFYVITKNSQQGSQTIIHCAVDDSIPENNGKYFAECKVAKCAPQALNQESSRKLWEISEKLVNFH
jgi:retinol dehydrogenase-12